jgi:hypothetical protein
MVSCSCEDAVAIHGNVQCGPRRVRVNRHCEIELFGHRICVPATQTIVPEPIHHRARWYDVLVLKDSSKIQNTPTVVVSHGPAGEIHTRLAQGDLNGKLKVLFVMFVVFACCCYGCLLLCVLVVVYLVCSVLFIIMCCRCCCFVLFVCGCCCVCLVLFLVFVGFPLVSL